VAHSGSVRAAGLALGVLADAVLADPRRGHPVAGFGRAAARLERATWADSVGHGAVHACVCVGAAVALGGAAERALAGGRARGVACTALATWAVLGGTSLGREGTAMARLLQAGDLAGARGRLGHLCARDPAGLDADALARATVESLAENTSDAVVAPLLWGAVAGVPGLLGYRAVNTLDAMVGYRSPRHLRFGRIAARADDIANLLPARVTGLLTVALAPAVGGSPRRAAGVLRADRRSHPSPNAGWCEAAAAGALGVRLGGTNAYDGRVEVRPVLGADGRAPAIGDIPRAVRLSRLVATAAAAVAVALAALGAPRGSGR
jgi:adenosylcobinamide-phosphate synthase